MTLYFSFTLMVWNSQALELRDGILKVALEWVILSALLPSFLSGACRRITPLENWTSRGPTTWRMWYIILLPSPKQFGWQSELLSVSPSRILNLESWLGRSMAAECRTAFWQIIEPPEFVKRKEEMWTWVMQNPQLEVLDSKRRTRGEKGGQLREAASGLLMLSGYRRNHNWLE